MWAFLTALVNVVAQPIVQALTRPKAPKPPSAVYGYRGQAAGRAAHEAATRAKPDAK